MPMDLLFVLISLSLQLQASNAALDAGLAARRPGTAAHKLDH